MVTVRRPGWFEKVPRWAIALVFGYLASGAVLVLRQLGTLSPLEFALYDGLVSSTRQVQPHSYVVLVTIGEQDLRTHGHPLSDALLARAVAALLRLEPRAVGIDLFRPSPRPPGEEELREVVLSDNRVVMVEVMGEEGTAVPAPVWLEGSNQVGFADFVRDDDGALRRGLLVMDSGGAASISLGLRLASKYLAREKGLAGPPIEWKGRRLNLNGHAVPRFRANDGAYVDADDRGYQLLLDYGGSFPRFERYGLGDLLKGRIPAEAVRDRVVLLGTTAQSVKDHHTTPATTAHGVEVHALVVDRLLGHALDGESGLRVLPSVAEALAVLGFGLVAALLVPILGSAALLGAEAALGLAALGGLAYFGFERGWWLPTVPAAIAWYASFGATAAISGFRERAERRRLGDLFNRFVPREVAEQIWQLRDEFLEGGRPKARRGEITVLVSDLEGFTTASERMDPEDLMEWANSFMGGLAAVIARSGGLVDDYAGDGIKADFGIFPHPAGDEISNHAVAAVECALEMGRTMERLNQQARDRKRLTARIRVGIFTGRAFLGFFGSADRLKFTTIGDTVNIAARLESHQKERFAEEGESVIRILVGGPTRALLGDRYELQDLGEAELKGKAEKVRIYRVWGHAKPPAPGEARAS